MQGGGAIVIPRDGCLDELHLTSTTGDLIISLTADVTTANVQDNQLYVPLTSSSSVFSLSSLRYMVADPGYDDRELYGYNKKTLGIDLVCPVVERYKVLLKRGLSWYVFMNRHWDRLSISKEEYL